MNITKTFFIFLFHIVFSICFVDYAKANAVSLKNCYMPWDFGDSEKNYIIVRPLGTNCHTICDNQCGEYSQSSNYSLTVPELNQDIIDECTKVCRSGNIYPKRTYRVKDDRNVFGWKWSAKRIKTNTSCTTGASDPESADFAYFPTDFAVKPDDTVFFTLANSQTQPDNTVFSNGFETVRITPSVFNPNTEFTPGKNINWNSRANSFFSTGVAVSAGDYFNISYGGKFLGYFRDGNYIPGPGDLDLSFNGSCDGKNFFPGQDLSTCYFKPDGSNGQYYCSDGDNKESVVTSSNYSQHMKNSMKICQKDGSGCFCGLSQRRGSIVRDSLKIDKANQKNVEMNQFKFEGMIGDFSTSDLQIKYRGGHIRAITCDMQNISIPYQSCHKKCDTFLHIDCHQVCGTKYRPGVKKFCTDNFGTSVPALPGNQMKSSKFIQESDYSNNYGGYEVEITTRRGPLKNGDGLQYAIIPSTGSAWDSDIAWQDATHLDGATKVTIPAPGVIYFRIDPSKITAGRANSMGGYGVIVTKHDSESHKVSGVISDVVNKVTGFFIGDDGNDVKSGRVQAIFNNLVTNTSIVTSIRAL